MAFLEVCKIHEFEKCVANLSSQLTPHRVFIISVDMLEISQKFAKALPLLPEFHRKPWNS